MDAQLTTGLRRILRPRFGSLEGFALDEGQVRVAQSVALVRQMPMIIIGNGVGSTLGYLALLASDNALDLTLLKFGMWVLLLPMLISWLRLRGRPLPETVSVRRIRHITVYSGILGLGWATLEFRYLNSIPFSLAAIMMASCAFLAISAVTTIFVMPWACVAFATPMMAAAIYISSQSQDPLSGPFVGLLLLMSLGMLWFLAVNWAGFLKVLELSAEKNRLLATLSQDLDEQKELVRALDEAKEAYRKANLALTALSQTDPLTGLANRRGFQNALRTEWLKAQVEGHALSLVMVDADHFKAVNDRHGHLKGDECLRTIASALQASVRASDVVARYGGDEFALIFPDLAGPEARSMAERIRTNVETMGAIFGLTASIGVATCSATQVLTASELVEQADGALFAAKQGGRNQFALAPWQEFSLRDEIWSNPS